MKMECDTVFRRKTNGLWPPSPYITEDTLICGHVLVEVSIWDVRQREHSKITLSTQPRINVGFKHLCLVLNRTLCMFHNFTWDDHPKLAHMFWEWLNRPAEWTFSRARCVDEAQITGGKKCNQYVTEAWVTLICLLSLDDWNWYDVSDRKYLYQKGGWIYTTVHALWSHRSRNYTKLNLYF